MLKDLAGVHSPIFSNVSPNERQIPPQPSYCEANILKQVLMQLLLVPRFPDVIQSKKSQGFLFITGRLRAFLRALRRYLR
jgi:hypothetical protein